VLTQLAGNPFDMYLGNPLHRVHLARDGTPGLQVADGVEPVTSPVSKEVSFLLIATQARPTDLWWQYFGSTDLWRGMVRGLHGSVIPHFRHVTEAEFPRRCCAIGRE
jgi:hypothetical protein